MYISEADALTLGDADWDGDKVKAIFGDIGKWVYAAHASEAVAMDKLKGEINSDQ